MRIYIHLYIVNRSYL